MLNLTKRKFYYRRTTCRVCGSKSLKKFLDLGRMPLADSFLTKNQFRKELFFPLATYLCSACNLIQLLDVVHWKLIFPDEYAFFSSASPAAVKHFTDYAQEISNRFNRSTNKFIVEIASNDGVLLKPLQEKGFRVLGIDPATNVAQIAQGRGIETFIEFFNEKLSKKVVKKYGQANVVLANNVLAHVDEPRDFIRGVKRLLDPSGAFIFEVQYGFDL
ncbi:methyltransferase domain-containing protein, partial [Patescibacteria group bacterium]|nr:methyltransferase domain-containing protein [Patescibacteria group bacterium]